MRRVVSRRALDQCAPNDAGGNAEPDWAALPPELLAMLLRRLDSTADVSRALRACTTARAAAEHALRLRAAAAGTRVPRALPAHECSWAQHLCWLERRAAFAAERAPYDGRLSASMFHSLLLTPPCALATHAPPAHAQQQTAVAAVDGGAAPAGPDGAAACPALLCLSFGIGAGGRLGHGDDRSRDTPTVIAALPAAPHAPSPPALPPAADTPLGAPAAAAPRPVGARLLCVASGAEFSLVLCHTDRTDHTDNTGAGSGGDGNGAAGGGRGGGSGRGGGASEVWAMGDNSDGCLGCGPEPTYPTPPATTATAAPTALAAAGALLAPPQPTQLAPAPAHASLPARVSLRALSPSMRVLSLAAGAHHALLLTECGAVFAWGRAAGGRLGLGGGECGGGGAASASANGESSGGGGGSSAEAEAEAEAVAVAKGGSDALLLPVTIARAAAPGDDSAPRHAHAHAGAPREAAAAALVLTPTRVPGFGGGCDRPDKAARGGVAPAAGDGEPPQPRAVAIAAGGSHSLVVSECGCAFAFGSSEYGALGLGGLLAAGSGGGWSGADGGGADDGGADGGAGSPARAKQVSHLPARLSTGALLPARAGAAAPRVLAASAGDAHSLLLVERSDRPGRAVLAFGCGWNGRLGLGDQRHRDVPALVEISMATVSMAADSPAVSAELMEADGGCGAPRAPTPTPPQPPQPPPQPCAVSAGGAHSLVCLSDGSVCAWGFGWSGQLGLGDDSTVYTPTRVAALPATAKVVAVAAGGVHSLALCEDGSAFSWGSGLGGRLGREGARRCEPTPARLRRGAGLGGAL